MAKYKDWVTAEALTKIRQWARIGLTNEQIAKNIGISGKTFYKWIKRFEGLNEALKRGRRHAVEKLENALFKKATGFTEDGRYYPPDTNAAVFLLKNWARDSYRDKPLNDLEQKALELENKRRELQNKVIELGFDGCTELSKIDRLLEAIDKEAFTEV